VAFWRLFPQSAFKRMPIGGHRETTRGLQEEAERNFHYFEGVREGGKGG